MEKKVKENPRMKCPGWCISTEQASMYYLHTLFIVLSPTCKRYPFLLTLLSYELTAPSYLYPSQLPAICLCWCLSYNPSPCKSLQISIFSFSNSVLSRHIKMLFSRYVAIQFLVGLFWRCYGDAV